MSVPPAAGDDPDDDDSDWSDDGRGDDQNGSDDSNGGDRPDDDGTDDSEPASSRHGDDRQWEISLEDLEGDGQPGRPAIEPGSPSLENAAFVAVGVLLTLYVLLGGF